MFMILECLDGSEVLILKSTVVRKHSVDVCLLDGMGYVDLKVPKWLESKTLDSLQLVLNTNFVF